MVSSAAILKARYIKKYHNRLNRFTRQILPLICFICLICCEKCIFLAHHIFTNFLTTLPAALLMRR